MIRRHLLAGVGLLMLAGAAPAFSEIAADVKPSPDVAWLVIGVQPANSRVEVVGAVAKDGVIKRFRPSLAAYRPVDGFILVKAKPGEVYAVQGSSVMFGKSIFGLRYDAVCRTPAFQADGGKVVYFTTMTYRDVDSAEQATLVRSTRGMIGSLYQDVSYSNDLEGARAFLKAHHPDLADSLEQGRHELMGIGRACG